MTKPVNVEYLQERVTDLEAEVERLREIVKGQHELFTNAVKEQTSDIENHKEALRRVVEALKACRAELDEYHAIEEGRHQCPIRESHGMFLAEEALALAKGVMGE